jgi:hypothetical protein
MICPTVPFEEMHFAMRSRKLNIGRIGHHWTGVKLQPLKLHSEINAVREGSIFYLWKPVYLQSSVTIWLISTKNLSDIAMA